LCLASGDGENKFKYVGRKMTTTNGFDNTSETNRPQNGALDFSEFFAKKSRLAMATKSRPTVSATVTASTSFVDGDSVAEEIANFFQQPLFDQNYEVCLESGVLLYSREH
jgi:hypothetical protein